MKYANAYSRHVLSLLFPLAIPAVGYGQTVTYLIHLHTSPPTSPSSPLEGDFFGYFNSDGSNFTSWSATEYTLGSNGPTLPIENVPIGGSSGLAGTATDSSINAATQDGTGTSIDSIVSIPFSALAATATPASTGSSWTEAGVPASGKITLLGQTLSVEFAQVYAVSPISWSAPASANSEANWESATSWSGPLAGNLSNVYFNTGSSSPYTVNLVNSESAGSLNVQGDNVGIGTNGNNLNVFGALNVGAGSLGTAGSLTLFANGNGAGSVTVANGVNVSAGSSLRGNVALTANVINAGTVIPAGAAPAKMVINGNYTQQTSGNLNVVVSGSLASTSFSSLKISGATTLAGNLNVALGSTGGADFQPSSSDTYQVIQSTGSLTGTFSNVKHLVAAYSSANPTQMDGVFKVNFSTIPGTAQTVSLSDYRQTTPMDFFGIGVNFSGDPDPTKQIRGDLDANSLAACLAANVPNFNTKDNVIPDSDSGGINSTLSGKSNSSDISSAWYQFVSQVGKKDTVVFYMSSHGDSNGIAISADGSEFTPATIASYLAYLPASTRKIVILDACDSGTVASNLLATSGTNPTIQNLAVLSSTLGSTNCETDPATDMGLFTEALESEISNGDFDLNQILNSCANGYFANLVGQSLNLEGDGTGVFEGLEPQLSETTDFTGDLVGTTTSVPEPFNAIFLLVVFAGVSLGRGRRVGGQMGNSKGSGVFDRGGG